MPWSLKRFQETRQSHFLTFSCYHRQPKLATQDACRVFNDALERVRRHYGLCIYGYVIMPEHVHLLVSEPERSTLAQGLKSLKQGVARRLALMRKNRFGKPLLRLQRLERAQVRREVTLPASKSSDARTSR